MIRKSFIGGFVLFLLVSCKKENAGDCFRSNGEEVTETRFPGNFTAIEMSDNIEVTVLKGTEFKVEVIAGKNIIRHVSSRVNNGVLKIENRNTCNFVRGYKRQMRMNITVPYIREILNNGVGRLNIDEHFSQDTIRVKAESSGDISIKGTYTCIKAVSSGNADIFISGVCNILNVFTLGTNFVKAEELSVSDYMYIETLTIGDCYVNAVGLNKLEYKIWREGNIYYKGNPAVISGYCDEESKGKLIRQD